MKKAVREKSDGPCRSRRRSSAVLSLVRRKENAVLVGTAQRPCTFTGRALGWSAALPKPVPAPPAARWIFVRFDTQQLPS